MPIFAVQHITLVRHVVGKVSEFALTLTLHLANCVQEAALCQCGKHVSPLASG